MTALLKSEARLLAREPAHLVFGLLLPVVILAIIGAVPATHHVEGGLGGIRTIDTYVPTLALFAITLIGVNVLPQTLAGYREHGVLRRLRTTPAGPARLLAAQLVVYMSAALVALAAVVVVGRVAFDVPLPDPVAGFVVTLVLAVPAIAALGTLVAALVRSSRAANLAGALAFMSMMFLGGLWFPRGYMPGALHTVSDATPVGAAVGALQDVTTGGHWPAASAFGVLIAWTVLATFAAVRTFRWE